MKRDAYRVIATASIRGDCGRVGRLGLRRRSRARAWPAWSVWRADRLIARGEVEPPPAVAEDWRQPNLGRLMNPWPSGVPGDVRVQAPAPRVELDEGRPKRDTHGQS